VGLFFCHNGDVYFSVNFMKRHSLEAYHHVSLSNIHLLQIVNAVSI
jgi:hypothetical protein